MVPFETPPKIMVYGHIVVLWLLFKLFIYPYVLVSVCQRNVEWSHRKSCKIQKQNNQNLFK